MREYTGYFWWTYDQAVKEANKHCKTKNKEHPFFGTYVSIVKGEPNNPNKPEECWAVTNRYDPRVSREIMSFVVEAVPPFNIKINGKTYTDNLSRLNKETHRLPAETLYNLVYNILDFEKEGYDIYMDNLGNNIVNLCIDDDTLYDSYNLDLYFIE